MGLAVIVARFAAVVAAGWPLAEDEVHIENDEVERGARRPRGGRSHFPGVMTKFHVYSFQSSSRDQ